MKLGRVWVLLGWALPAVAQYAGPAILSRGEAPSSLNPPEIKFRPFVEISASYTTGLAGVATDAQGDLPNLASYGASLYFGVSGTHSWRRTKLGLSYSGSITDYIQQSSFDSISQSLQLGIEHQISRHARLTFSESGGVTKQGFGLFGLTPSVPYDPTQTYVPTTDFFNNRTYFLSTAVSLVMQKSARLSFSFTGMNFLSRYSSRALTGSMGLGAGADAQYRLSRVSTLGAGYHYSIFKYSSLSGTPEGHTFMISYSRALSATTEFSANVGAMRVEQKFIQSVPVDPIIASLLGVSTTTEINHFVSWGAVWGGRISHRFRNGLVYADGGRSLSPGNGLFLTSYVTSTGGGYSFTGLRTWSLSALFHYNWAKSVGNILGSYDDLSTGIQLSRRLFRSTHLVAGVEARRYSSPNFQNYNRWTESAHIGIGFTPGEIPLRIW